MPVILFTLLSILVLSTKTTDTESIWVECTSMSYICFVEIFIIALVPGIVLFFMVYDLKMHFFDKMVPRSVSWYYKKKKFAFYPLLTCDKNIYSATSHSPERTTIILNAKKKIFTKERKDPV